MNIQDVADYIIWKTCEAGIVPNLLKLQKLAYYAEAWRWAIAKHELSGAEFQAWVHGPVNRELYDRFKDTKSLYSTADTSDIREDFDPDSLDPEERGHVDAVLEVYAAFTGSQLEAMTHNEFPWTEARKGYRSTERCEVAIKTEHMQQYYGARISETTHPA
jgi:uncharacterized phage-associated protein